MGKDDVLVYFFYEDDGALFTYVGIVFCSQAKRLYYPLIKQKGNLNFLKSKVF